MAPATLVSPTDPFDPLDQLLNSRYTEINTELAKLKNVLTQSVNQSLPSANASLPGTLYMYRVGGCVSITGDVGVSVANYIATTAGRLIATLPPQYRPVTDLTFAVPSPDSATPNITRVAKLTVLAGSGQILLSGYNSGTHPAGIFVFPHVTFATAAPHPAL